MTEIASVFGESDVVPEVVWSVVFTYLVDAQSIYNIQLTCRRTRLWKQDALREFKLDWVYNNIESFLGDEMTEQLRDGLLTEISLGCNNIGFEGAKAITEALKVNTSLTEIYLEYNNIEEEGAKAIAEALKVNTSLTIIDLDNNMIVDEDAKELAEALKVNTSLTEIYLSANNIGDEGAEAIAEALKVNTSLKKLRSTKYSFSIPPL